MGLYLITCPKCKCKHTWFSGNTDQRCIECIPKDPNQNYCPCGGIILADTEDFKIPLCYECYEATKVNDESTRIKSERI